MAGLDQPAAELHALSLVKAEPDIPSLLEGKTTHFRVGHVAFSHQGMAAETASPTRR